jgi:hypothetical protein
VKGFKKLLGIGGSSSNPASGEGSAGERHHRSSRVRDGSREHHSGGERGSRSSRHHHSHSSDIRRFADTGERLHRQASEAEGHRPRHGQSYLPNSSHHEKSLKDKLNSGERLAENDAAGKPRRKKSEPLIPSADPDEFALAHKKATGRRGSKHPVGESSLRGELHLMEQDQTPGDADELVSEAEKRILDENKKQQAHYRYEARKAEARRKDKEERGAAHSSGKIHDVMGSTDEDTGAYSRSPITRDEALKNLRSHRKAQAAAGGSTSTARPPPPPSLAQINASNAADDARDASAGGSTSTLRPPPPPSLAQINDTNPDARARRPGASQLTEEQKRQNRAALIAAKNPGAAAAAAARRAPAGSGAAGSGQYGAGKPPPPPPRHDGY